MDTHNVLVPGDAFLLKMGRRQDPIRLNDVLSAIRVDFRRVMRRLPKPAEFQAIHRLAYKVKPFTCVTYVFYCDTLQSQIIKEEKIEW